MMTRQHTKLCFLHIYFGYYFKTANEFPSLDTCKVNLDGDSTLFGIHVTADESQDAGLTITKDLPNGNTQEQYGLATATGIETTFS